MLLKNLYSTKLHTKNNRVSGEKLGWGRALKISALTKAQQKLKTWYPGEYVGTPVSCSPVTEAASVEIRNTQSRLAWEGGFELGGRATGQPAERCAGLQQCLLGQESPLQGTDFSLTLS